MSHRYDHQNDIRDRELRASKAPGDTFLCKCCGKFKRILGRKRIAGLWCCSSCAAGGSIIETK